MGLLYGEREIKGLGWALGGERKKVWGVWEVWEVWGVWRVIFWILS
ncbi:hypothetical protein [Nostoc linckia]|nr:hypothetical protein [Nostoc linckia]